VSELYHTAFNISINYYLCVILFRIFSRRQCSIVIIGLRRTVEPTS